MTDLTFDKLATTEQGADTISQADADTIWAEESRGDDRLGILPGGCEFPLLAGDDPGGESEAGDFEPTLEPELEWNDPPILPEGDVLF